MHKYNAGNLSKILIHFIIYCAIVSSINIRVINTIKFVDHYAFIKVYRPGYKIFIGHF